MSKCLAAESAPEGRTETNSVTTYTRTQAALNHYLTPGLHNNGCVYKYNLGNIEINYLAQLFNQFSFSALSFYHFSLYSKEELFIASNWLLVF